MLEPEEWAKIPILDKPALREIDTDAFYDDFCIAPREAVAEYWRSGGSTGRPLFYPRTKEDMRYALLGMARVLDCAGFAPSDTAHMSLPLGIHPAGHLMARGGEELGVGMVWAGGGNTLPSLAQLDLMRLFRPTGWIGMASYGLQLANLAKGEGLDLAAMSIDKVLCTAEPLSASKREKLGALFGATVRDCFGMTEVMMLGGEEGHADGAGAGFRLWSDCCYPEVLDPDTLEPVGEGEVGLLVVTALVTNNATPFIRWNTGDMVTLRSGETEGAARIGADAEAGRSRYGVFPLLAHAHRTAGFVKVRGVNIGFTEFEDLMFAHANVSDFRVEVVFTGTRDELDLHVELDGVDEAEGMEALAALVRRTFDVAPRVAVVAPGTIAQAFEGSVKPARFTDQRG